MGVSYGCGVEVAIAKRSFARPRDVGPAREQRIGPPVALGCVSIRLKFGFAFLLAARQFANYVCIALAGSVGFLVLFIHKENSFIRGSAQIARRRLSREIVKMHLCVLTRFPQGARKIRPCTKNPSPARVKRDFTRFAVSKIEMKSQRATATRRSASGAAVRLTQGGELGRALGCACSSGGKTDAVFPLRWAELLRLFEPRSSPPPHAAGCNSSELVALTAGGEQLKRNEWVVLLRPFRVARAAASGRGGPQLTLLLGPAGFNSPKLRASSAIPFGIAVLGESDASAARGGAPRTNSTALGDGWVLCSCGS